MSSDEAAVESSLLALARHAAGVGDAPVLSSKSDEINRLWQRASEEGLRGLLTEQLARQGLDNARSRRSRLDDFAHGARLMSFLQRLGRELERRGCQVLVLKGASLIDSLYGGLVGRRPMSDLDVLPLPGQRRVLYQLLRDLGLHQGVCSWLGTGVEVDVHEDLIGSEFLPARVLAFRFETAELFATAGEMSPGLLRLDEAHLALHLAVHALKHGYCRWIWLLDLALLIPHLEAAEILDAAERTGAARALAYACLALESAFVLPLPAWAGQLPTVGNFEKAYLHAALQRPQSLTLGGVMTTFSIPEWRHRTLYLRQLCWPSRRLLGAAEGPGEAKILRARRLAGKALPGAFKLAKLWCRGRPEGGGSSSLVGP